MSRACKAASLVGILVATSLMVAPIASAHHPVIDASLDCNGLVTYTVTADSQDASRNNSNIEILDTSGNRQPAATGVFNIGNHWSFSGSFTVPVGATSDTVTAEALGSWGDGYFNPSNNTSVHVTRPIDCTSIATTLSSSAILAGESAHDSATLSGATSTAGGTVTYTIYLDGNCSTLSTAPALNQTVNVTNGSVPNSSTVTFPNAGTYFWQAAYSGDGSNHDTTSACTSEVLGVGAVVTATATPASNPAIALTESPKMQAITSGSAATFTIVVTNTGDVMLTNISVVDAQSPRCEATSSTIPELASLAPGASLTYPCTVPNVTTSFTNVATDSGMAPNGSQVTASDTAAVSVTSPFKPPIPAVTQSAIAHASITIVTTPKSQTTAHGGTATFEITVTNTGDGPLAHVKVSDLLSTNCEKSLGLLAAGASHSYSCRRSDVTAGFTNDAQATGKPPKGPDVFDSDSAAVKTGPFTAPTVTPESVVSKTRQGITTARKVLRKPKPTVVSHVQPRITG